MRRIWVWALTLSLLSGCGKRALLPYAREMDNTALVRVVGVDAREEGVYLTAAAGSRPGEETAVVLSAEGLSIPAAAQAVQRLGERYISFGHVDQILVGEEQANRGLAELMDYLAREPRLGPGAQLWVVYGGAARAAETAGAVERLAQLGADAETGTAKLGCSAARLMSVMARDGSTYLPALTLASERENEGGTALVPEGYAIVRQGKLVCRTDPETTIGLELMEGEGIGSIAELMLSDGTRVALEIKKVRTDCRPAFSNEELAGADVSCELAARVVQAGRKLSAKDVERLCRGLERMQGERMARVLELGQYWDADFLNLKQRLQMACPGKREVIREQWDEAFRGLELRVTVRGEVECSGSAERWG